MASTAGRTRSDKGRDNKLLTLLRQAGFKDELPPSTISWLNTHPIFMWLGDNLSKENFISPADRALYEEIELMGKEPVDARSLMEAMDLSESGSEDNVEDWLDRPEVEDMEAAIQV